MSQNRYVNFLLGLIILAGLSGCVAPTPYDYTAFRANRPASILVLPPLNNSLEVDASYGVLARTTHPLAESGYYVLPVAMVDEAFKNNGLTQPAEMHSAAPKKLREIFGADAALYIEVTDYGASYKVVSSDVTVAANAKLIDLRSGDLLWEGQARASTAEQKRHGSGGGIISVLVAAVVTQIINTLDEDRSNEMADITSYRLLSAARENGIMFGPRSPHYPID